MSWRRLDAFFVIMVILLSSIVCGLLTKKCAMCVYFQTYLYYVNIEKSFLSTVFHQNVQITPVTFYAFASLQKNCNSCNVPKLEFDRFFFFPNVLGSQGSIFSERSSTFIKDYVMNTMRSLTAWEAMSERQLFI